jgi:hypothetical protein
VIWVFDNVPSLHPGVWMQVLQQEYHTHAHQTRQDNHLQIHLLAEKVSLSMNKTS